MTAGGLLKQSGYSVQGNAKTIEVKVNVLGLAGLATQTGLEITMVHLPPDTSKWNRAGLLVCRSLLSGDSPTRPDNPE